MAKKQVAVSLRKPPSPEKLDAFVAVAEPTPPSSGSRPVGREPLEGTKGVDPPGQTVVDDIDDVTPVTPEIAAAPTPAPPLVDAEGRTLRAVTVHLHQALAERLTLHCIENDRDMSNVVGDALESHLSRRLNAGSWAPPEEPEAPPRTGSFGGAGPFGADAFRWTEAFKGSRIEALLQLSRALIGLWRQRSWVA